MDLQNSTEVWKPVLGYEEHYEVSNFGRVRGLKASQRLRKHPRLLKPGTRVGGYLCVSLFRAPECQQRYVHRLVLAAFVGPCPEGQQTRHLNGVSSDNRLENLCWGTPAENADDKRRHKTTSAGESNPNARLTKTDVHEIRSRYTAGDLQYRIAEDFRISQAHTSAICLKKAWKNV